MRRADPDKVRHAMARDRVTAQSQEQQRWFASLTPEHRAIHERGWPCGECIGAIGQRLNETFTRRRQKGTP